MTYVVLVLAMGLAWTTSNTGCRSAYEGERGAPRQALETKARRGGSAPTYRSQARQSMRDQPSPRSHGFDRERLWSTENDWEPAIAVAPDRPVVYHLTTRYGATGPGLPDPAMILRRSLDGGRTFGPDRLLSAIPGPQNDPQLAAAAKGRVYAAWLPDYCIQVAHSDDYGATWSVPLEILQPALPPSFSDRPILVTSRDGRDVYVAFNASDSYVVASHDFARSFSAPVLTSADQRYWFHGGGAVTLDATVYFAATDFSQTFAGRANVSVIRSHDGGSSWQTTLVDVSRAMPSCNWSPGCPTGFLGSTADLDVDADGLIMLVYHVSQTPAAPQRLFARSSLDGVAWGAPFELSTPSPGVNHAFANVAAGTSSGDFRVSWQDDRMGIGRWNTWFRRTIDGGQTWSPAVRLSDAAGTTPYKSEGGYAFPYGDYNGLAVDSRGRNHVIWGEGASWIGPGGSWYTRSRRTR